MLNFIFSPVKLVFGDLMLFGEKKTSSKAMVGIFCATCTVNGYPGFFLKLLTFKTF